MILSVDNKHPQQININFIIPYRLNVSFCIRFTNVENTLRPTAKMKINVVPCLVSWI